MKCIATPKTDCCMELLLYPTTCHIIYCVGTYCHLLGYRGCILDMGRGCSSHEKVEGKGSKCKIMGGMVVGVTRHQE